ncbi:MAG: SDR family oxidoreductase [Thermodesulfobacteriota bacterium]|nr:SDR family oxidoreductase [Thermodesulfobacteriota bacterium]
MANLLEGKNAVVTGSSRGLGRAFAIALAEAGANVVINGTVAPDVNQVVEEIKAKGGSAVSCTKSVTTWEGARQVIHSAVDNFGRIDILVNNAGIVRDRMVFNMTEEEFDSVIAVHLKGTFSCSRHASILMREQKSGRIINITAHGGLRGGIGRSNYAAAKAGIAGMTRCWAQELVRYNITINAVSPVAKTRMTEPLIERARQRAKESGDPEPSLEEMGLGEPKEVAPLVVYLACDEAGWVNGQIIFLGGFRLALYSHPNMIRYAFMPKGWTVDLLRQQIKSTVGSELESLG